MGLTERSVCIWVESVKPVLLISRSCAVGVLQLHSLLPAFRFPLFAFRELLNSVFLGAGRLIADPGLALVQPLMLTPARLSFSVNPNSPRSDSG